MRAVGTTRICSTCRPLCQTEPSNARVYACSPQDFKFRPLKVSPSARIRVDPMIPEFQSSNLTDWAIWCVKLEKNSTCLCLFYWKSRGLLCFKGLWLNWDSSNTIFTFYMNVLNTSSQEFTPIFKFKLCFILNLNTSANNHLLSKYIATVLMFSAAS